MGRVEARAPTSRTCRGSRLANDRIAGWFSENVHQSVTELFALDLLVLVANRLVQCATYTVLELINDILLI